LPKLTSGWPKDLQEENYKDKAVMGAFDNYKGRVSIVRAAEYIGYAIRKDKGRGRSVTMGIPGGDGKWTDQIVVVNCQDPNSNYYFNRNEDSSDKGDLISFIQNHLSDFETRLCIHASDKRTGNYDVQAITAVLEALSGMSFSNPVRSISMAQTDYSPAEFDITKYEVRDLNAVNRDFLVNTRHLSEKTVKLFSRFLYSVAYKGKRFYNVAFPYHIPGKQEVCNFELRNYKYKGHAAGGNKVNASWVATFAKEPYQVRNVFLFESGIDALSFFELNSAILSARLQSIALVSTGGSLTRAQVNALKEYFEMANFVCCFDNDESGVRYDITTACSVLNLSIERSVQENMVQFVCNGRTFSIPKEKLTFTAFVKAAGIRQPVYVKKPRCTDKSLNEDGSVDVVWFKDWNDCLKYRKTPKKEYVLYKGRGRDFNDV
jgi:hypothetical protein